jgi:hypothetical protein
MFRLPLFCLPLVMLAPLTFAAPHFSGGGNLKAAPIGQTQVSANQRFALRAELQPEAVRAKISSDGRFSVSAELAAPQSARTACGVLSDAIFQNGFEN